MLNFANAIEEEFNQLSDDIYELRENIQELILNFNNIMIEMDNRVNKLERLREWDKLKAKLSRECDEFDRMK